MTTNIDTYLIKLDVEINGTLFAAASFTATYELNRIPVAQILLPIGTDIISGKSSGIEEKLHEFAIRPTIKVYGSMTSVFSTRGEKQRFKWLGDTDSKLNFLLFDGTVTGTSYLRTKNQTYVVVMATHWLSKLTESVVMNAQSHPSYPADMLFAAMLPDGLAAGNTVAGGAQQNGRTWAALAGDPQSMPTAVLQKDLWTGVKECLKKMASANLQFISPTVLGGSPPVNQTVKDTLDRISDTANPDFSAIGLGATNAADGKVLTGMRNSLRAILGTANNLLFHTYWDVIVGGLCGTFLLDVIPRINDALIVPRNPLVNKEFKTITAQEYDTIDLQLNIPQPLRAVLLFSNAGTNTDNVLLARTGQPQLVGKYDSKLPGAVQYRRMPEFLSLISLAATHAVASTGVKPAAAPVIGNALPDYVPKGRSTAITPGVATPTNVAQQAKTLRTAVTSLADRFAHAIFLTEVLRGGFGVIQGPWREDIAPGSIVRIEADYAIYGQVTRCTTTLNAETNIARTGYHVSHVRTEAENNAKEGKLSVEKHPFWEEATFSGATMGIKK